MKGTCNTYISPNFVSVFGGDVEADAEIPTIFEPEIHTEINNIIITPECVEKKIRKLKTSSAPGPDQIHPRILKECVKEVSIPLAMIYQKSIEEGELPEDFKQTNISPLYKKGDKLQTSNYRPINMASVPGKLLESLVKDALLNHLEGNNLLHDSQHGFRANRSVATCLLEYLGDVTKSIDEEIPWITFIGDFAKAFDKVPFKIMLKKLENHGIKGKLLKWIQNWTKDRKQRVVLNGTASEWADVTSSVVQGSVLGPVLFLIFINDLDLKIQERAPGVKLYKFADDSKLGQRIRNNEDVKMFQEAIEALVEWCELNGMQLHPAKCSVMKFGKYIDENFSLMGNEVHESECERDLGVYISNDLKSSNHVQVISGKANGVLSRLKRAAMYRNNTFVDLYKVYVRPILEANSVAWNPDKEVDIKRLESVQRRALKSVNGFAEKSYEERLKCAGLPTLRERREMMDLIQTYKCIEQGIRKLPQVNDRHCVNTRGAEKGNLVKEKCRTNARKHFFDNRVVNTWNSLPIEIRQSKTVELFKVKIKEFYK